MKGWGGIKPTCNDGVCEERRRFRVMMVGGRVQPFGWRKKCLVKNCPSMSLLVKKSLRSYTGHIKVGKKQQLEYSLIKSYTFDLL